MAWALVENGALATVGERVSARPRMSGAGLETISA